MEGRLSLAVLVSGSGTTLQNLIDRQRRGELRAEVKVVVADRPDIYALTRATQAGIPAVVVDRHDYPDYKAHSEAIYAAISGYRLDYLVLAGYLSRLHIAPQWHLRIINIHPALLPAFGGKGMYGDRVHQAVLEHGCKVSGCTVHFCDEEYDHGPIIAQVAVAVLDDDTVETLRERVQRAERELYPTVINWLAEGRVEVDGRRVKVRGIDRLRRALKEADG